jgi:hypothetical protein
MLAAGCITWREIAPYTPCEDLASQVGFGVEASGRKKNNAANPAEQSLRLRNVALPTVL